MNKKIIDYLIKEGYTVYSSFYPIIDNCINWWKGKNDFHKYSKSRRITRQIFPSAQI